MISVENILLEQASKHNLAVWQVKMLKPILKVLLQEKKFVEFGNKYPHLHGIDIVEQVFSYFNIRCETDISEFENIPAEGAVVLVANHPIGSIDGLALLKTVACVRPDVKIVANQTLLAIEPLKNLLIAVDNMGGYANCRQIKEIQAHLEKNGALILFPSGEVSRISLKGVRDRKWSSGFLRLATKAHASIVPVHVKGRNSAFFYITSFISKPLSTYLLVHEMFKQRGKCLKIHIGKCISCSTLQDKQLSTEELAKRFRSHIYMIGKGKAGCLDTDAPIALPQDRASLRAEVESCEKLGIMPDEKAIYLYRRKNETYSFILHELGRLREISFRAVGEGSGRRLDLDIYDNYYYHLILWDFRNSEIIGAYRFIPTDEFAMNYDLDKLYSYSLFRYGDKMRYVLEHGIELGRSFIQPKYWKRKGLDYLWHGIGAYLAKYPQCRYLFGPVSISGALPLEAKELLVSFYKLHFSPKEQIATSKCPYIVSSENDFAKFGGEDYHENFIYLKSMLTNMGCGVPTLYKQYSELCEQGGVEFIDFGVDPDFNNCIDGLVVVDISKLKPPRYQRYIAPYLQGDIKEAV